MNSDAKYGFMLGPSDRMKQEIGEIVVAHANCEPMLATLMKALTNTDDRTNLVLIQNLNLKGSSMAKLISALAENAAHLSPLLRERVQTLIKNYDTLSRSRNEVAHWQWNPCEPGAEKALIRNTLSKKPAENEKTYTLEHLRSITFGLHQVFGLAGSIATIISSGLPKEAAPQILAVVDQMFEKIRTAMQDVPEPSAEEQP
ncbi:MULTISPECIES: hypothetical protein [Pseudomonas syringae group]|uniref:hypothetical protein n=1 Tax=Pseudomonas syringae group TaxID=136849 RepID=UPI000A402C06|nr:MULTISPECIES: hypothetical protein [Pseudomonas syringae group]RMV87686.1 Prophage PssSM-02, Orf65 [Pseudomonas amygdali pv. sesami]